MSRLDDEATVLELACLTQDRTKAEQAALARVAGRLDRAWERRRRADRWQPTPISPTTRRAQPSRRAQLVDITWTDGAGA